MENGVAYQNKDIVSKIFGETVKNRQLSVYGIRIPRVVRMLPTNLPAIEVNEMRMDNAYELEDGSYAIIDYESTYDEANKLKYMQYILRVLRNLQKEHKLADIRLRIIVIYTADVTRDKTRSKLNLGALNLNIQEGFLSDIDGDSEYRKIEKKLKRNVRLTDTDIMKLILLPLTYKEQRKKQEAAMLSVQLADSIDDKDAQRFALAGVISFSDKVLENWFKEGIKRSLDMTTIGRMYEEEKIAYGEEIKKAVTEEVTEKVTEKERKIGIKSVVSICQSVGLSMTDAAEKLIGAYPSEEKNAMAWVEKYWETTPQMLQ